MRLLSSLTILSSLWAFASAQGSTPSPTPTTSTSATSTSSSTATATPTTPLISTTVSYDTLYDNKAGSLSSVACSDGSYGLLTKNYTTFGSLPNYPLIGGAFSIAGWNSPNCGSCYELAYTTTGAGNTTTTTRVNILAIDVAVNSFNIALGGLNRLTGGRGVELGRVNVVARQVASSVCGL
ncbi:Cerato-platanin-domain-containing protein [Ephemerocybe angulata]|uniref:Cerato-platanin-domain-containing protein n=1 Tax=Ephemerocybe angulata TaxID=980116 RepID=A0A8H6I4J3_9AGAR|nr:Cerato-platanin-domain-containing protein [Tulosesus angulatus]